MSEAIRLFADEDQEAALNFDIVVYGREFVDLTDHGSIPYRVLWRGLAASWGKAPDGDFVIQRRVKLAPEHTVLVEAAVFPRDFVSVIEPSGIIVDAEKYVEQQEEFAAQQAAAQEQAQLAAAGQVLGLRPEAAVGPNRAARRKG